MHRALFGFVLFLGVAPWTPVAARAASGREIADLQARVAADPRDLEARTRLGIAWAEIAATGSEDAIAAALEQFDALLAAKPECAIARVHRGAAFVLRAQHAPMVEKMSCAQRGFREMDAAVASAPDDAAVRLVRAVNSGQMPQFLGRAVLARSDFDWLVTLAGDETAAVPAVLRRAIFHQAGAFALKERRSEAVHLLEQALAIDAPMPPDAQVQSMLALAREEFTPHEHAKTEEPAETPPP
jgi:hypothetical protein